MYHSPELLDGTAFFFRKCARRQKEIRKRKIKSPRKLDPYFFMLKKKYNSNRLNKAIGFSRRWNGNKGRLGNSLDYQNMGKLLSFLWNKSVCYLGNKGERERVQNKHEESDGSSLCFPGVN